MMARWCSLALLCLSTLLLPSCALRPQPEPPTLQQLDPSKLSFSPSDTAKLQPDPPSLRGAPGSVSPADGIIRVFQLDNSKPPVDAFINDDGSFRVFLDWSLKVGDELRIQTLSSAGRSLPIDLIVSDLSGKASLSSRALDDCLVLSPALELSLTSSIQNSQASIEIQNHCTQSISFKPLWMRRPIDSLNFPIPLPASLAPGSTFTLPIAYQGSVDLEEILFLEATSPSLDRRPITLRAAAAKP